MMTQNLKQLFKATALTLMISSASFTHAAPKDHIVAIVGNSAILQSDIDQGVAETLHQLKAKNTETPPVQLVEQQVLNQLIIQNAQLEMVNRYGLKVDENALNEAVLKVAKQSGTNSLEAFQTKLDTLAPGTYEALRGRISDDLLIQRLRQQQVMSRIKISDQDVANFLKSPEGQAAVGSQAHVIHVRINGTADTKTLAATAKAVQAELSTTSDISALQSKYSSNDIKVEAQDMGFRPLNEIPPELSARVSTLNPGQTTEIIAARDGLHVLKLIERKGNEQKALVPQFQARHILIKSSEVVSKDMAKQMIDSIYNRLKAGEDFNTLASTYSNDPGSARDGGSLGWVSPGMMVPEFDKMMQETPVNQISQPFETQFGWHILQVTGQHQQDMTKEYQERMARQILGERQFDAELDNWIRELRANTYVEIKDSRLDPKATQKN